MDPLIYVTCGFLRSYAIAVPNPIKPRSSVIAIRDWPWALDKMTIDNLMFYEITLNASSQCDMVFFYIKYPFVIPEHIQRILVNLFCIRKAYTIHPLIGMNITQDARHKPREENGIDMQLSALTLLVCLPFVHGSPAASFALASAIWERPMSPLEVTTLLWLCWFGFTLNKEPNKPSKPKMPSGSVNLPWSPAIFLECRTFSFVLTTVESLTGSEFKKSGRPSSVGNGTTLNEDVEGAEIVLVLATIVVVLLVRPSITSSPRRESASSSSLPSPDAVDTVRF